MSCHLPCCPCTCQMLSWDMVQWAATGTADNWPRTSNSQIAAEINCWMQCRPVTAWSDSHEYSQITPHSGLWVIFCEFKVWYWLYPSPEVLYAKWGYLECDIAEPNWNISTLFCFKMEFKYHIMPNQMLMQNRLKYQAIRGPWPDVARRTMPSAQ